MNNKAFTTRRAFLQSAPLAAAAAAAPAMAMAIGENPREKVDRIAADLADALAEFWDGKFHAEVFPTNKGYGGFKLVVTDMFSGESQEEKVRRMVRMLQFEMTKLSTMETVGGSAHEVTWGSANHYLRLAKDEGDGKDLLVGFVPPLGSPAYEAREV